MQVVVISKVPWLEPFNMSRVQFLPEGVTVKDLLKALDLKYSDSLLVVVNRHQADADAKLSDGDEVMLLIPIYGG